MNMPISAHIPARKIALAAAGVLVLWAAYTTLQTLYVVGSVGEGWSAALGFLPGLAGVSLLLRAGFTREDCFLVGRPLSGRGLAVLSGIFVLSLATMLPVMVWTGWSWTAALLLAPAGGVAQELFFRSALLPTLGAIFNRRGKLGLALHAVLFGLWHIGPAFVGAPVWAVIAVMAVPTLAGIGWGWQVMRDRTVVWAMVQHSLIWVIGLQFSVAG